VNGDPQGFWFVFRGSELLVHEEDTEGPGARVPLGDEWTWLGLETGEPHAVGFLGGIPCYAAGLAPETEPPEGMAFEGLRRLWGRLDEEAWKLAGRAVQMLEWDRNHRFCGRCGTPTERRSSELSRTCPNCGLQHFPRISPAVIVRVERGDEILLARSPHFAPGVYSTLAGFVEPGESLEDTIRREIQEEVGVTVTNIRYFGSQPWPFPNSLMIGFVADYESGEITPQEGEIEDARWFTVDDLPGLPSKYSIARALIEEFIAKKTSPQPLS
jgi:NAD+ diphosphatase